MKSVFPVSRRSFQLALAALLAATVTAASTVAVSAAESDVTLYEVTETMSMKGGKLARRLATAALSGTAEVGTALCPKKLATQLGIPHCSITAFGFDNIDLRMAKGPVSGTFAVVVQDHNVVDGPELVVLRGTFAGEIDLSPAIIGRDGIHVSGDELPLGTLTATWRAEGDPTGPLAGAVETGALNGTFRLPFLSIFDRETPVYLLKATPWTEQPVNANERIFGSPMVRLEITLKKR